MVTHESEWQRGLRVLGVSDHGTCDRCGGDVQLYSPAFRRYCDRCIQEARTAERAMMAARHLEDLYARGDVPAGARACVLSADPPAHNEDAYMRARRWDGRQNVYIHGPVGSGKTWLARCLLNAAVLMEDLALPSIREVSAMQIARSARALPGRNEDRELSDLPPAIAGLKDYGILFVDDLCRAGWTQSAILAFWRLVDVRSDSNRPMILASTLPHDRQMEMMAAQVPELKTCIQSIFDRLRRRRVPLDIRLREPPGNSQEQMSLGM